MNTDMIEKQGFDAFWWWSRSFKIR